MIKNVISKFKVFRDNADKEFEYWFNLAVKLGEEVKTLPSVPRLAKSWIRFEPNVENDASLSYHKRDHSIP